MVSVLWPLIIYLFYPDWFLATIISKLLTLWQPQDFVQERAVFYSVLLHHGNKSSIKTQLERLWCCSFWGPSASFSWVSVTCSCSCGRFQAWISRNLRSQSLEFNFKKIMKIKVGFGFWLQNEWVLSIRT